VVFTLFKICYHIGITNFADEVGFGQWWVHWSWLEPAVSNMGAAPDLFSQKSLPLPKPCHINQMHSHIQLLRYQLLSQANLHFGDDYSASEPTEGELKTPIVCLHTRFFAKCTCGRVGNWI